MLFIPDFKCNPLLVSKLTKELSYSVNFFLDFVLFQDLYSDRVKGIGKENVGLYTLKETNDRNKTKTHGLAEAVTGENCRLWHMRLGHPSPTYMKNMSL